MNAIKKLWWRVLYLCDLGGTGPARLYVNLNWELRRLFRRRR